MARSWPVSGVSTPSLIGLPWAVPLDPPYALDPLSAAVNIATAPTAAINLYRFTTFLLPSCLPTTRLAHDETFPSRRAGQPYPDPTSCAVDISDDAPLSVVARAAGQLRAARRERREDIGACIQHAPCSVQQAPRRLRMRLAFAYKRC